MKTPAEREAQEFLRACLNEIIRIERKLRALSAQIRRAQKQARKHMEDLNGGVASVRRACAYDAKARKAESERFSLRLRLSTYRRALARMVSL